MNVASCDILGVDTRRRRPTHKKTKKKFFIYISKSRPHAFFLLLFNVISVAAIRRKVVIYFKFFGYRLVNQPRIKWTDAQPIVCLQSSMNSNLDGKTYDK